MFKGDGREAGPRKRLIWQGLLLMQCVSNKTKKPFFIKVTLESKSSKSKSSVPLCHRLKAAHQTKL